MMGERLGRGSMLVGIDSKENAIAAAHEEIGDDPRFRLIVADASEGIPFEDQSFDVVYSRTFWNV